MARIDRRAFEPPWSAGCFAAELALDHSRSLVVRIDGAEERRVAGYLVYHQVAEEMHILRIAVSPRRRRRGLARALLRCGMAGARSEGAATAVLEVRPANRPARRLYERLGFLPAGRRPGYYAGTGEDALIWTANLKEAG
jgi:ribosomal-protein-alanine N-acetyltransferase